MMVFLNNHHSGIFVSALVSPQLTCNLDSGGIKVPGTKMLLWKTDKVRRDKGIQIYRYSGKLTRICN